MPSDLDSASEWSWRSKAVVVMLVGGLFLSMMRHQSVYRDNYRSLDDCRRDWAPSGASAQCASTSPSNGGVLRFAGPSYELGARPATANPQLRIGSELVARGGFGRSGARFSAAS